MAARRMATFDLKREVKADDLHALLDRVLDLHGCAACGLVGLDLHFREALIDKEFNPERLQGLDGVANISVSRF